MSTVRTCIPRSSRSKAPTRFLLSSMQCNRQGTIMAKALQPADWVRPRGFSNALSIPGPGRWIVIAGQIGSDGQGNVVSDDMGAQTAQSFRNIVRLLAE